MLLVIWPMKMDVHSVHRLFHAWLKREWGVPKRWQPVHRPPRSSQYRLENTPLLTWASEFRGLGCAVSNRDHGGETQIQGHQWHYTKPDSITECLGCFCKEESVLSKLVKPKCRFKPKAAPVTKTSTEETSCIYIPHVSWAVHSPKVQIRVWVQTSESLDSSASV